MIEPPASAEPGLPTAPELTQTSDSDAPAPASITPTPLLVNSRSRAPVALVVLAVVAALAAIQIGASVLLPIVVAAFLATLLNPAVRWLSLRGLPRWLAALLVVSIGLTATGAASVALYEPAMEAASKSPRTVYRIKMKLSGMTKPLADAGAVGEALDMIQDMGSKPKPKPVAVMDNGGGVSETLGTVLRASATVFSVIMLVYLFLIYGESLFRRAVEIAPTLSDKRRTVSIVRAMQADISRYMATITVVNLLLGVAVAGMLYLCGVEDFLLWGAMAALLNYAPYIGPLLSFVMLLVVCLLQFDQLSAGLLPPMLYLLLNGVESQVVTPLVLGRNFALNPLIILAWLLLWGWLWGVAGLLIALPLLVTAKIICNHTDSLKDWAKVLEK